MIFNLYMPSGGGAKPTYTITFRDQGDAILQTVTVKEGETPKYSGNTPSLSGWTFKGWQPALSPASGDANYWADYEYPTGMSNKILKTWDEIIADGDAGNTEGYKELDTKIMVTTDGKPLCYELGGIGVDEIAFDEINHSKAAFTWIAKTIDGKCQWNTSNTNSGGYPSSNYKTYLEGTCLNHIPSNIKSAMKSVTKAYRMGSGDSGATKSASYTIWPPSLLEMNWSDTSSYRESSGVKYTAYTSNSQRIRYDSSGTASVARLRSALNYSNDAWGIVSNGDWDTNYCSNSYGALPCFCIGEITGETKPEIQGEV